MSAFCIYAVSRSACLGNAKRKVDMGVRSQRGKWIRGMTESEWSRSVGLAAAAMYSSAKPSAVSPKFDAPQFAEHWAAIALRQGMIDNWTLYAYQPTGAKDPKTKLDVMDWMPYVRPVIEA